MCAVRPVDEACNCIFLAYLIYYDVSNKEVHRHGVCFVSSAGQSAELFIYSIKPSVCRSVTLNAVTNRNRWTQRPEVLHTGAYWWTVLGDQKLGHPDLLYSVLGHRRKCLYLHYLCKQLTCGHQICTMGASGRDATTAWDLT